MRSGSEARSFALEQAVCTCTMVKIAWIQSQVDVAAQGEYCSMPDCQTGGWAEEEEGLVCFFAQPILPQKMCFLVSTPAFLYLELWDGFPPQNGAFSAVFPSLGFTSPFCQAAFAVLHWFSYLSPFQPPILCSGISLSLLSFPSPVPCPVSLCSPSARVVSCLVFFF